MTDKKSGISCRDTENVDVGKIQIIYIKKGVSSYIEGQDEWRKEVGRNREEIVAKI